MIKILIVDDSREMCELMTSALKSLGVTVDSALSIADAKNKFSLETYDLFLLDLKFPDGDGFSLVNSIRDLPQYKLTPIIVVSGSSDIPSKLSAFSIGADDYISKPFHILEFRARLEAKIKRITQQGENEDVVRFGPLTLYSSRQVVEVDSSGEKIGLSPREFRLLCYLARHKDMIFSRQQILDQIWGSEVFVNDRTVDTHVYLIRKKLGHYSYLIESVPGAGYRATTLTPPQRQGQIDPVKNL